MDIHRSRFVPYPPSAINALAFSHARSFDSQEDSECLRLAVGRANGNIEIWNPAKGAWLQERVFMGGKDRSVEGLAWTQEPYGIDAQGKNIPGRLRLFSIGYSNSITEWDLASGLPARHSDGNHSEVWCFAAQPRPRASKDSRLEQDFEQQLVAGCADGTLVLLSTADNDLRFDRFLSRPSTKKARVLTVAYQKTDVVLAGFADSTIRVFDTRKRMNIRTITMGSGPPGGPRDILVWKVKCFPNGNFASGDSTGDIRIYDGKNYSEIQRISGHEADVLDLAVSQDGGMLFSAGMDRRTCYYTSVRKKGKHNPTWRKVSHKRYHDHDVKALATYEGTKLNVIVSGGIDARPVVLPLQKFESELSRGLALLPHSPALASAPDARLVVSWWNCEVRIWRIKEGTDGAEKPKVVARLALQGDENITSASITRDGGLLAISTIGEVKLFRLTEPNPASGYSLRIQKLNTPSSTGARLVRFSRDGKWLAIISDTQDIKVARFITSDEQPRMVDKLMSLHRLTRDDATTDALNGFWGSYNRTITHAEFSTDGTALAVADLAGYVDIWLVEGHEDATAPELDVAEAPSALEDHDESDDEQDTEVITTFGQRWVRNPSAHHIPRLDASPLLLSFEPSPLETGVPEPNGNPAVHPTRHNPHPHSHDLPKTKQYLLLVSSNQRLYHFDVLAGRLSDWSRRNPPSSYPHKFRVLEDLTKGCIWDKSGQNLRLWLYGEKWLFMFDLSRDLPLSNPIEDSQAVNGAKGNGTTASKKRKRNAGKEPAWKDASGAGDVVPHKEAPFAKTRKFTSLSEEFPRRWVDLRNEVGDPDSDHEIEDTEEALAKLRRSIDENGNDLANGDEHDINIGEESKRNEEAWWCTFKYRPILGIVPVGNELQTPEVVLVERPSWELDLPPRFVGNHE